MLYTINKHGDWLEQHASDFIISNIPAYELIWQNFIGHQGNGSMAVMNNITEEDEEIRQHFSQHHYTILESIYFMQLIVLDESNTKQIQSFNDYRKVINQLMSYQAYSGRLRDNMEKCFSLIAPATEAKKATDKLDSFYHQRHVFIHGRKVPFLIDVDNLFKIAPIKNDTSSRIGFGLEMPWETISAEDMLYMEDALNKSIEELKPLVQNLLSNLFEYVKNFISSRNLVIKNPVQLQYHQSLISGSTYNSQIACSSSFNVSGSTKL